MTTVEFGAVASYIQTHGGDYRTQRQVATLTSMVSGFFLKKPLTVQTLMPDYPWPKAARLPARRTRLDLAKRVKAG